MSRSNSRLGGALAEVWKLWRAEPVIGLLGSAALVAVVVVAAYLVVAAVPAILAAPFIHDYQWYYDAAARFLSDPGSTYDDPNFLYPPPSLVFFVPLTWLPLEVSYTLFGLGIVASVMASVWLTVRLYEGSRGITVPGSVIATMVLVGLAFGPTQQTFKLGQVTALVMFLALLLLWASARRPVLAGLFLTAGFWLKLFPAALGFLGFRPDREKRYMLGLAIGLLLVPVALLPVIPPHLYQEYFLALLPEFSGLASMAADNHSLGAVLERLRQPVEVRMTTLHVPITGVAKVAVYAYAVLAFGAAYALFFLSGRNQVLVPGLIIMAATPVVLPLGWDHGFLAVLPLVIVLLLESRERGIWTSLGVAAIALIFFIPKPPDQLMAYLVEAAPRFSVELLNARHLLATTAAIVLALWWEGARLTKPLDHSSVPAMKYASESS